MEMDDHQGIIALTAAMAANVVHQTYDCTHTQNTQINVRENRTKREKKQSTDNNFL